MFEALTQDWTKSLSRSDAKTLLECYRLSHEPNAVNLTALRNFINRCTLVTSDGKVVDHPAHPHEEHRLNASYPDTSYVSCGITMGEYATAENDASAWELEMNKVLSKSEKEFFRLPFHAGMSIVDALWVLASFHPTPRIRAWWRTAYLHYIQLMRSMEPKPFAGA